VYLIIEARLLIVFAGTIWIFYRFINLLIKKHTINKKFLLREFIKFIFLLYIMFVIGMTLLPIRTKVTHVFSPVINLNLFNSPSINTTFGLKNIVGNLVLLSPLAIFLPLIGYQKFEKTRNLLILAFIVSLGIEIFQYLEVYFGIADGMRTSDIGDVILNVSGIIIGKYIYSNLFK
jgi:glycopeptide antibiotics resistance protein